jgi:hypothetical protein
MTKVGLPPTYPVNIVVVLPVFGRDSQPEYQIEIHLGGRGEWTLPDLDDALHYAQALLCPGVA